MSGVSSGSPASHTSPWQLGGGHMAQQNGVAKRKVHVAEHIQQNVDLCILVLIKSIYFSAAKVK